jgi:prepilin-type N-terminal cleavage/methylation domain-containing protein
VLKNENLTPILKESFENFAFNFKNQSVSMYNSQKKGNPIMYRRKSAFTLAEVLITLGIIGVVAAITIPNLVTSYKSKILRTQFDKSYAMIKQVYKMMEADGVFLDWDEYTYAENIELFQKYLSGSTYCGTGAGSTKCYKGTSMIYDYTNINDDTKNSSFIYFRLDDGTFQLMSGETVFLEMSKWVSIDINGYKNKPNKLGYDLFTFQFLDDGVYPMGYTGTYFADNLDMYCNAGKNSSYSGYTCAQKAVTNPDYFKWVVKNIK